MEFVTLKPFIVHGPGGSKYIVEAWEIGEVVSGFGFFRVTFKRATNRTFNASEDIFKNGEAMSFVDFYSTYKDNQEMLEKLKKAIEVSENITNNTLNFLTEEEMEL